MTNRAAARAPVAGAVSREMPAAAYASSSSRVSRSRRVCASRSATRLPRRVSTACWRWSRWRPAPDSWRGWPGSSAAPGRRTSPSWPSPLPTPGSAGAAGVHMSRSRRAARLRGRPAAPPHRVRRPARSGLQRRAPGQRHHAQRHHPHDGPSQRGPALVTARQAEQLARAEGPARPSRGRAPTAGSSPSARSPPPISSGYVTVNHAGLNMPALLSIAWLPRAHLTTLQS